MTTLSNGMRVATETTPGHSVSVGVFINSGSRYETEDSNGSAHFLEHMFFKGSKNKSQSEVSPQFHAPFTRPTVHAMQDPARRAARSSRAHTAEQRDPEPEPDPDPSLP